MRPNGYILHSTDRHIVISTGHARPSKNAKTGPMVQIWILARGQNPQAAVKSGRDVNVCGDCVHRGDGKGNGRSCYVNVSRAPLAVWKAYRRGRYPYLAPEAIPAAFAGRAVRFGAYGDPSLSAWHRSEALSSGSLKGGKVETYYSDNGPSCICGGTIYRYGVFADGTVETFCYGCHKKGSFLSYAQPSIPPQSAKEISILHRYHFQANKVR